MPDDDQGSKATADANAKTKALTAETAAINAEIARITATRKLADARVPLASNRAADASLAAAKHARELADARKSEAQSELDRLKARVGDIPASGISGAVELGEKAASIETALLASQAMTVAAEAAASSLSAHIAGSDAAIVIFPSGQLPDLKALTRLRACNRILLEEFANAVRELDSAAGAGAALGHPENAQAAFALPAVGVALEAVSGLIGYFRSDFEVAGTELDADHVAFAELLAGKLREKIPAARVHLPSVYEGTSQAVLDDFFSKELAPLAKVNHEALTKLGGAENRILELSAESTQVAGTADADKSRQHLLSRKIARMQVAAERLKQVTLTYDALLDSLVTARDKLDALIRHYALFDAPGRKQVFALTARVHRIGGAHYTEKNVWTLFGAMPFHVMGGIVASYSLFESESGNLLASRTMPVHSGFRRVKHLAAFFPPP